MCGRYQLNQADLPQTMQSFADKIKTGEIFPTNSAPIRTADGTRTMAWGFPKFGDRGVIINARAETAAEKRMFRAALMQRRCAIPASGFYEWDREKRKVFFTSAENFLWMAGIWTRYENEDRYVILTTQPNESVRDVHNRMPVVLWPGEEEDWIYNEARTMEILRKIPPMLKSVRI